MLKKRKLKTYVTGTAAVLLLIFLLNSAAVYARRTLLQQGIAEEVLRFHVLANSDSEEDQKVKLEVRDAVLDWAAAEVGYASDITENTSNYKLANDEKTEMELFLKDNLGKIETIANRILEENQMTYHATAKIEQCYFPDRTYGDCTFPAGWYEALRICLGEAKGQNWWCVLYPKLCFADYLHAVVDEASLLQLEEVLTVEEYESLLQKPGEWKIGFKWF